MCVRALEEEGKEREREKEEEEDVQRHSFDFLVRIHTDEKHGWVAAIFGVDRNGKNTQSVGENVRQRGEEERGGGGGDE